MTKFSVKRNVLYDYLDPQGLNGDNTDGRLLFAKDGIFLGNGNGGSGFATQVAVSSESIKTSIANGIIASGAMVMAGTLNLDGYSEPFEILNNKLFTAEEIEEITTVTQFKNIIQVAAVKCGWSFLVTTAGILMQGITCSVGDIVYIVKNRNLNPSGSLNSNDIFVISIESSALAQEVNARIEGDVSLQDDIDELSSNLYFSDILVEQIIAGTVPSSKINEFHTHVANNQCQIFIKSGANSCYIPCDSNDTDQGSTVKFAFTYQGVYYQVTISSSNVMTVNGIEILPTATTQEIQSIINDYTIN